MQTFLVTGGIRDYVELTPQSIEETSDLVRVAKSAFLEKPDLFFLDLGHTTLRLRIFVSDERPNAKKLSPQEREELDTQK